MAFFILYCREDGIQIRGPFTKAELLKKITPDKDGATYYGTNNEFLSNIPDSDGPCWVADKDKILIIEGEIRIPRAKAVVTEFEV